eukprot:gene12148-16265_t
MNRANQNNLIQQTNLTLVTIRTAEIGYFSTFFNNFGTQCALMVGFICGSLSQVPGLDAHVNQSWIVIYWITSAICISSAIHVLVCATLVSVYGQGLAIRGPLGSMVKAIDGMIIEQKQIVISFIATMVFFAFQCLGMWWIMMDSLSAISCCIVTFLGMFYWYHSCLRIYNRFKYNSSPLSLWEEKDDRDKMMEDLGDISHSSSYVSGSTSGNNNKHIQALKLAAISEHTGTNNLRENLLDDKSEISKFDNSGGGNSSSQQKKGSLLGLFNKSKDDQSVFGNESVISPLTMIGDTNDDKAPSTGYLTMLIKKSKFSEVWERKYFVLLGYNIFYYKDKRAYESNPGSPINKRPIELDGYSLVAGAIEPPFLISLIPMDAEDIRKAWKFRCDTPGEFDSWIDIFSNALKLLQSNTQSIDRDDLVVISGDSKN